MPVRLGWDAMLAEFRALGGTAENIILRQGPRGRGVFPVDPAKPIRLHSPSNLLVCAEDTEIRDGRFVVKASATLGERERAFFDNYQQDFVWGAGVFDDLWQAPFEWSQLPQEIQDTLPVSRSRFAEPSVELCRQQYLRTRSISYRNSSVVMPVMEFVNHGSGFSGYEFKDGIVIGGVFDGEVLVNYGVGDCWDLATSYGFCDARDYAYGLKGAFKFEDCRIDISRTFKLVEPFNDYMLPIVRVEGDTVRFPFLTLGNSKFPHLPRLIFLRITKNTPIKRPDELFELVHHYNRLLLLRFLRRSEGPAIPLVATLRSAAYQQLETLSSYWGTASP